MYSDNSKSDEEDFEDTYETYEVSCRKEMHLMTQTLCLPWARTQE